MSALLYAKDRCEVHGKLRCERCRCATCKRGYILNTGTVDWCSRRYAAKDPCDGWQTWEPPKVPDVKEPEGPPEPPSSCIACRFTVTSGDKAFLGGVAVAKLFSDRKTGKALAKAFNEEMCKEHQEALRSLKDLKLLHLSEAIVACYDSSV